MTPDKKNIIRRLLNGAILSVFRRDKENPCWIGYGGKKPETVESDFAKYLINFEWVELDGGNEYYEEEDYRKSEKLFNKVKTLIYSVGDTVKYKHAFDGTKNGVITTELNPLGTKVRIGGVLNIAYEVEYCVLSRTRMVLTEKTLIESEVEYYSANDNMGELKWFYLK